MSLKLIKNKVEKKKIEALPSKKERILRLFESGEKEIEKIASLIGSTPSYVGAVLAKKGLIENYFDLYTSTAVPLNVYTKYFRGQLGFKDVKTAQSGVKKLENLYRFFGNRQDRAGQHHTLEMALMMLDRARWTGKIAEAEVYRRWLVGKLSQPLTAETVKIPQQLELKLVA